MNCLNEEATQFEYAIYCKVGLNEPYMIRDREPFKSMSEVYSFLKEVKTRHERYGRNFYIDNDFYDNKYPNSLEGSYYKVLRRKISSWEEFTSQNSDNDDTQKNSYLKVL